MGKRVIRIIEVSQATPAELEVLAKLVGVSPEEANKAKKEGRMRGTVTFTEAPAIVRISQYIEFLEKMKKEHGDVPVTARNAYGYIESMPLIEEVLEGMKFTPDEDDGSASWVQGNGTGKNRGGRIIVLFDGEGE